MKKALLRVSAFMFVCSMAFPALAADRATAKIINTAGQEIGEALLTEGPNGVLIYVSAKNLQPGPKAIHIHSVGTCEDPGQGFVASKGHVNPASKQHGLMNADGPDSGDLPNLFVHSDGTVEVEMFSPFASLNSAAGRTMLLDEDGSALVIHEKRDDHMTQPIGGAGARIACGLISAN